MVLPLIGLGIGAIGAGLGLAQGFASKDRAYAKQRKALGSRFEAARGDISAAQGRMALDNQAIAAAAGGNTPIAGRNAARANAAGMGEVFVAQNRLQDQKEAGMQQLEVQQQADRDRRKAAGIQGLASLGASLVSFGSGSPAGGIGAATQGLGFSPQSQGEAQAGQLSTPQLQQLAGRQAQLQDVLQIGRDFGVDPAQQQQQDMAAFAALPQTPFSGNTANMQAGFAPGTTGGAQAPQNPFALGAAQMLRQGGSPGLQSLAQSGRDRALSEFEVIAQTVAPETANRLRDRIASGQITPEAAVRLLQTGSM